MLYDDTYKGEDDFNCAGVGDGGTPLHYAAVASKKNTKTIKTFLTYIQEANDGGCDGRFVDDINCYGNEESYTPLDCVYEYNESSIRQKIIDLFRSNGGKRADEMDV